MNKLKGHPLSNILTGCEVKSVNTQGDHCTVTTADAQTSQSKLVIVATGSNANPLSKELRAHPKGEDIAVGIRAYYKHLDVDGDYSHLYVVKEHMPAAFYITPLSDGIYNVNFVIRKDVVNNKKLNLKTEFANFIETHPILKGKFSDATRVSQFQGSSLALGTKKRVLYGDRYMIAGDTAGLIDLITANGIPQAMLSGKLAALQAQACINANNFSQEFLSAYQSKLYKAVKGELSVGRFINPLLKYKFINHFLLGTLNYFSDKGSKNSTLGDLIYTKRPLLLLVSPSFYYRLIRRN